MAFPSNLPYHCVPCLSVTYGLLISSSLAAKFLEGKFPALFIVVNSTEASTQASMSQFSSVQSLSRGRLSATPWTAARQASLSITNSWDLLKLMSIESVIPSKCHPLSSQLQSPRELQNVPGHPLCGSFQGEVG